MGRMELGWRAVALLWLATGGWVISVVAGLLAIPVFLLDILFVAIRGEGLSHGRVSMFVADSIKWNAEQATYVILGSGHGSFQALPG